MSKFTLTLLDTTGIQDYIFASNRLQENIGASELVYRATTLWAFDTLDKLKLQHNIDSSHPLDWTFKLDKIEDGKLDAEVIQAAGGNTFILFKEKDNAIVFVKTLTLRLLKDAPGLTVLAQHLHDFDFAKDSLFDARKTLEANMRQHKQTWLGHAATLGLGVTAMCESTGLPAVTSLDGDNAGTLISAEVVAKRNFSQAANKRLDEQLEPASDTYIYPFDLDKIGREKGEESYVAVVHADGNRMGEAAARLANGKPNREYITEIRTFSKKINEISLAALSRVVALVVQAVERDAIPLVVEGGKKFLPLRPLVFGGDDVTFVCNGRIGLELAATYLETFRTEAEKHGLDLHASAGVSVVKLHYPFARAYALAEDLIASAKSLTRGENCSALDWHFAQSGLSGSLEHIRKREYTVSDGKLYMRPMNLDTWHNVEKVIAAFSGEYWGEKRNKVIGLRESLRKGPDAVAKYIQDFALRDLPEIAGDEARRTGWKDGICQYFDAIELLEHYVALKNEEVQK